jgi:hypothetical protein
VSLQWIVGGAGLVVAVSLAIFTAWRRDGKDRDLGSVSTHWVSEHRMSGQAHDENR